MYDLIKYFLKRASGDAPCHVPKVAAGERVYAVGDIHGRHDLLTYMLRQLADDAGSFQDAREAWFIFLGDYVDRGDQSAQVLTELCDIAKTEANPFQFLMGNHEAAMLAFLEDPIRGADWLGWGGRQTLSSYGLAPVSRDPEKAELLVTRDALYEKAKDHVPFLRGLQRYTVSGEIIFAHASLDPALSLQEQPDAALLWGHIPSGEDAGLPGHRLIHGHFADHEPVVRPERICVDTGAYYSGRLTAVRLDDAETFLHVDVQDLMP